MSVTFNPVAKNCQTAVGGNEAVIGSDFPRSGLVDAVALAIEILSSSEYAKTPGFFDKISRFQDFSTASLAWQLGGNAVVS